MGWGVGEEPHSACVCGWSSFRGFQTSLHKVGVEAGSLAGQRQLVHARRLPRHLDCGRDAGHVRGGEGSAESEGLLQKPELVSLLLVVRFCSGGSGSDLALTTY